VALQTGSALHVHAAVPAAPVQLWCVPQATGAAYARQPLLPSVQVARAPDTHDVWPCVQLSLHVEEHAAFGASPEQDSGDVHTEVDAT
jgi:hypothetical protein